MGTQKRRRSSQRRRIRIRFTAAEFTESDRPRRRLQVEDPPWELLKPSENAETVNGGDSSPVTRRNDRHIFSRFRVKKGALDATVHVRQPIAQVLHFS